MFLTPDIRLVTIQCLKNASLSDDMLDLQKILDDPKLSNADVLNK